MGIPATWRNAGVVAAALAAIALIFTPLLADPDLWGHVRFGLDLWQTGEIVRADTYSYLTAGQPWINHEWLAEAIYGLLFGRFGPTGLIGLNLALSLSTLGLLYYHLCRRGVGVMAAGVLLAGTALLLRPSVLNIRPQVFTYLLFAGVVVIIDAAERGDTRWLWAIAPLCALWVNLHGGVLAGVGIFLLWGSVHLAAAAWRERRAPAILSLQGRVILVNMLAAASALLLNPYGAGLPAFLLRTALVPRPEIAEWQPMVPTSTWGELYAIGVLASALGLAFSRRERKAALVAALCCTAVLPLISARHAPLFAVAAAGLAGEHIADAAGRLLPRQLAARLAAHIPASCSLIPWILAFALAAVAIPRLNGIRIDPGSADIPACAVALLKGSGATGNMITEFNWGEYVLWHLGPQVRVSVDGRRETVYSDAVFRANLAFMRGEDGWEALLSASAPDMALVDRSRPAFARMQERSGWQLVYEDPVAAIFAPASSPLIARLRQIPPPRLPCDGRGLSFP